MSIAKAEGRGQQLKQRVDTALGWVLAALMGFAVLNVLWQVFTRYVIGNPSTYTDELSRYLLIWVGLLGASYAAGKRMHLAVDLLPNKLTGKPHHALGLAIDVLVFAFAFFVMVVGGSRLVGLTLMLEQTSAALRVPLGYVYFVLPLSGALIMFYTILFMIDHVRALRGDVPSVPETERSTAEGFAMEVHDTGGPLSEQPAEIGASTSPER